MTPLKPPKNSPLKKPSQEQQRRSERDTEKREIHLNKKTLPVLILAAALVLVSAGVMMGTQSTITSIQIFAEETDDAEAITINLFSRISGTGRYAGTAMLLFEYESDRVADAEIEIDGPETEATINYQRFYRGNGNYTFTISIDGVTDSDERHIVKTAHLLKISLPDGNNRTNEVTLNQGFGIYKNEEAYNTHTPIPENSVLGTGTIYLKDNTTDYVLASADYHIKGKNISITYVQGAAIAKIVPNYNITFTFTEDAYPSGTPVYFQIEFKNTLQPDITLTETSDRTQWPEEFYTVY